MPDFSGTWQGEGWGTVVLRTTNKGEFAGTYTDTFGKDVGRITVRWTTASRRYEGTWSEGNYRFGRIALEAAKDGATISGAYTTDPKCEHQPGVPSLASLRWSRVKPKSEAELPAAADLEKADASAPEKVQGPGDVRGNEQLNKTVLALDKQLWDAAKTGDWKVYDRLLAKDYIGHSALYGRHDKTATVESLKDWRYSLLSVRDVETRKISKEVAILTYVYSAKVTSVLDGMARTYTDHQTTLVWAYRDGAWVLVFCQETADPKSPPTPTDPRKTGFRPGFPNPK
jgi:hypothetical protein